MQTGTVKLYSLRYGDARAWLAAALFICGNIAMPQICHMFNAGGRIWLPIYLFTLIGAYKYGLRVGLLTAAASPLLNSLLFGMPPAAALPAILLKSALLALFAGIAAARWQKASLLLIAAAVLAAQAVGTLGEWAMVGNLHAATQDLRIGTPGIMLQIFGGWAFINYVIRK